MISLFTRPLPPLVLAVLLLSAGAIGCSRGEGRVPSSALDSSLVAQDTTLDASLAQILRRQERFRVFSTLLDSAGLLPALARGGPYTVFAATDPGLQKMPEGLVDELLLPENRERLRQVVAHHVHRGQIDRDSLRGMTELPTLSGQPLAVTTEGGRLLIGEQRTSEFAITGSNGRIFAFDALAMPPVGQRSSTVAIPEAPAPDSAATDTSRYDRVGDDRGTGAGQSTGDGGGDAGGN